MTDDKLFLIHIQEAIRKIESYSSDGRDAFMKSSLQQDGIIRQFEIIGEAAKNLSKDLRNTHNEIRWREVAGFRDVLIHNYMGVDLIQVWNVVEHILPTFKNQIEAILSETRS